MFSRGQDVTADATLHGLRQCEVLRQCETSEPSGPAVLNVTTEGLTASPAPGYHVYLSYFDWNSSLVCLSGY